MNILVTGASGLIGTAVLSRLRENGHQVVSLRRAATSNGPGFTWNPENKQLHLDPVFPLDAVIHLAGENIAQRWTAEAKARIRASRVEATQFLAEALACSAQLPKVLVTASGVGFYGERGADTLDEDSPPGAGFLAEVCRAWERASMALQPRGVRVVHLRLGIVLARQGGALSKMLPAFRFGLGGRVGSGQQYWSWITLEDVARVVELLVSDDRFSGAVNTVAPESVTNGAFAGALSRVLHRPAWLPLPAFVVKAVFGEMGHETLLTSTRVRPARLLNAGFKFHFPGLDAALAHLVTGTP